MRNTESAWSVCWRSALAILLTVIFGLIWSAVKIWPVVKFSIAILAMIGAAYLCLAGLAKLENVGLDFG